jgi:hypothetical protein
LVGVKTFWSACANEADNAERAQSNPISRFFIYAQPVPRALRTGEKVGAACSDQDSVGRYRHATI